MLASGGRLLHTRGWADGPEHTVTYAVDFFPYDWDHSDDFQVSIGGGIQAAITARSLKLEPQHAVTPLVAVGDTLTTGAVVDLLRVEDAELVPQVALVARSDTKNVQTRWHIWTPMNAPGPYAFLATGRRSGWVPLDGAEFDGMGT